MESVLRFLNTQMPQPGLYGWFHIVSLVLTAVATFLLCRFSKKLQPRKVVLVTAIIVCILEVYKQVNYSFTYDDGIQFYYLWYAFPFQFCSTPMYIGLLAGLTKRGKIHDAANAYLATYAVFAGVCVMFYPATVFTPVVGVNIQTMICHGSMIVIGVYLMYSGYVKLQYKTVLKAMPIFAICVAIAAIMNEVAYRTGLLENHNFDMFFISPYVTPSLPVYSLVQAVVPFPWCLLIYVAGFTAAAYIILLAGMGIRKLARKKAIV